MFTFCMRSALCVIVVKVTVIHYSVVFVMLDVLKLKIQLCGVGIISWHYVVPQDLKRKPFQQSLNF